MFLIRVFVSVCVALLMGACTYTPIPQYAAGPRTMQPGQPVGPTLSIQQTQYQTTPGAAAQQEVVLCKTGPGGGLVHPWDRQNATGLCPASEFDSRALAQYHQEEFAMRQQEQKLAQSTERYAPPPDEQGSTYRQVPQEERGSWYQRMMRKQESAAPQNERRAQTVRPRSPWSPEFRPHHERSRLAEPSGNCNGLTVNTTKWVMFNCGSGSLVYKPSSPKKFRLVPNDGSEPEEQEVPPSSADTSQQHMQTGDDAGDNTQL